MGRGWFKQNVLRHLAWAGTLVLVPLGVSCGTTNTQPDALQQTLTPLGLFFVSVATALTLPINLAAAAAATLASSRNRRIPRRIVAVSIGCVLWAVICPLLTTLSAGRPSAVPQPDPGSAIIVGALIGAAFGAMADLSRA